MQQDANREITAQDLADKFLKEGAKHRVEVINDQLIERITANLSSKSRDLFAECTRFESSAMKKPVRMLINTFLPF